MGYSRTLAALSTDGCEEEAAAVGERKCLSGTTARPRGNTAPVAKGHACRLFPRASFFLSLRHFRRARKRDFASNWGSGGGEETQGRELGRHWSSSVARARTLRVRRPPGLRTQCHCIQCTRLVRTPTFIRACSLVLSTPGIQNIFELCPIKKKRNGRFVAVPMIKSNNCTHCSTMVVIYSSKLCM